MNSNKTNSDLIRGTKDVLASDEFEPKKVKERITTFVDQDVLDVIRARAAERGMGYQTLINHMLRAMIDLGNPTYADMVNAVKSLHARVDALETKAKVKIPERVYAKKRA